MSYEEKSQGPERTEYGAVEGILDSLVIGAVNRILPHPTDANIMYIGSVNGGVWKTTNALSISFGSEIESNLNTNINFLDHPESNPYIFNSTNTPLQEIQDMQSGYSNKQLVIRPIQ